MTPAQEVGNAVSMLLPTAALALHASWAAPNQLVTILLIGSAMHLPVSFTYHLGCACDRYPDCIDNDMRRLDQSMQHVSGTLYAFALSGGSVAYTLGNAAANLHSIRQLWHPETSNDGLRWRHVLASVLLYTAPMLWRGDWRNYILAAASMGFGTFAFVPGCAGGWGHTLFHIALVAFAHALAESAGKA